MALQDLIQEMNQGAPAVEPTPATPAQTTVVDPPVAQKAPETPATPTPEPQKTEPKPADIKSIINPEPQKSGGEPQATPTPAPVPDEVFNNRLSELTDGSLKSLGDFERVIGHYNELLEQAEKGFEPKFKDERAKLVYQLLDQSAGNEPEAAMRVLRALNFKPEGKSPKEILFERYQLDPKNSDLTPFKAQEYFDIEYDQKYGDLESNPLRQRQLDLEVRASLEEIQKVQNDFKTADQEPAQRNEKVERSLKTAVESFGGIKLAFSENPTENDFLNIAVDDPMELQAINAEILNPNQAYNDFIAQFDFNTPQGYEDLVRETYERRNHKEIRQRAYDQGIKLGRLQAIQEARNASTPRDVSNVGTPPAAGQKSFLDTWAEAKKA